MTSPQHLEMEIDLLEKKKKALESDVDCKAYQYNKNMPTDEGMSDDSVAILILKSLARDVDRLEAEIAEKRIQLFEQEGARPARPLDQLSEEIRRFVISAYIEPARREGQNEISVAAGEVHKGLRYKSRMPAVCSVLGSKRLETEARIRRTGTSGPHQSSTTQFTFALL